MKRDIFLGMFLATLIWSHASAGDSLFTYAGTFSNGGTLTGSMLIDTATGALDSGSVTVSDGLYSGVYNAVGGVYWPDTSGTIEFVMAGTINAVQTLLPTGSVYSGGSGLVGYTGQALCGACNDVTALVAGGVIVADATSGEIVDPPPTASLASASAPEINPGGTFTGLTLLVGWLLILRGRRS